MKKEVCTPKFKDGDYLISGDIVVYIEQITIPNTRYFYRILYPHKEKLHSCLWETFDKHILTSKASNRIIRLLYE